MVGVFRGIPVEMRYTVISFAEIGFLDFRVSSVDHAFLVSVGIVDVIVGVNSRLSGR